MANTKNSASEKAVKTQDAAPSLGRLIKITVICSAVVFVVVFVGVFVFSVLESSDDEVPTPASEDGGGTDSSSIPTVELPVSPIEITNEQLQEELLQEIELLLNRFPDVPESLHVSAMGYAGLLQTKKAEDYWKICIMAAPQHVGPRLGLATILSERGDDEQAVEVSKKAIADGCVSPELFFRLATSQSRLGDIEGAASTLRNAVRIYPDVPQNWLLLGQVETQLLQFEKAEGSILKAIELGHETSSAYLALANTCQRLGKTEEAAQHRERFTELRDGDDDAFEDLSFQEIYQQALRPMTVGILTMAAAVYAEQGDAEEEKRLCFRALAIDPENTSTLEQLISSYRSAEKILEAQAVQNRLIEVEPNNPLHYFNLASLQGALGDLEGAVESLEKAKSLEPYLAFPSLGLVQIYMNVGDYAKARFHAENAVQCEPSFQTYQTLATVCQAMGDVEAANAARSRALQSGAPNQ